MRKKITFTAAAICILACAVLAVTGCQPTPSREAIVGKGGSQLEQKALETAQNGPVQTNGRILWNETKSVNIEGIGEYTVAVDMDAAMPEIPEKVPVYLIEPKELDIDFMKKASKYLMPGEILDGRETKEDVMKEMLDFKKDIAAHPIISERQENVDNWQQFMDKRYNDAPDQNAKAQYEYIQKDGERVLSLKNYFSDNSIGHFSASGGVGSGVIDGFFFRINRFNRIFLYLDSIPGKGAQAKGTQMTYEQALATADKAMADLFDVPFHMACSNIIDVINENEDLWNDGEETSQGQAYVFCYTREYEGIPSLFIKSAPTFGTDNTEDAKPYGREGACIVVDDRGIAEMWYDSYSNTIQKLNENAGLMPFDKVLERFKDGVFYHNFWGAPGSSSNIRITRIEFGMVREPLKDKPGQYMIVPAWNFIGNTGNDEWDYESEGQGKSILALSAIDGSIITDYQQMTDPK